MIHFLWKKKEGRRIHAVAWEEVCKPLSEGGLGIIKLKEMNDACQMSRTWKMITGKEAWASFMRDKYMKGDSFWSTKTVKKGSTTWNHAQKYKASIQLHSQWKMGDGSQISLLFDRWIPNKPSLHHMGIDHDQGTRFKDIWNNGSWNIPPQWNGNNAREIGQFSSIPNMEDTLEWKGQHNHSPTLSVKKAWQVIRRRSRKVDWHRILWKSKILPKHKITIWKLWKGKLPVENWWKGRNHSLESRCYLCHNEEENLHHLTIDWLVAAAIWKKLADLFHIPGTQNWTYKV